MKGCAFFVGVVTPSSIIKVPVEEEPASQPLGHSQGLALLWTLALCAKDSKGIRGPNAITAKT